MSHRGYTVTKRVKAMRRAKAEEMLKAYNEKYPTPQAKLAALPATGSTKQRARLEALVNAEKEKANATKAAKAAKADKKDKSE